MTHAWQHVSGGILETGDGDETDLLGAAEVVSAVPGVWIVDRVRVAADAPS